jgi:uroporphyrinogen-III synthase
MPQPVLLLRASSDSDPYHLALSSALYTPYSISPLQTTIVNHAELAARISKLPTVDAVIMTSARSAEAWRGAVLSVLGALDASAQRDNPALYAWHTLPFYVVGNATATALTTPDDARPRLPIPKDVRGAEETGTSVRLAQLIVEELQGKSAKVLYLTGDKNKYNLPETLKEAGIDLDELQVYETGGSETFSDELDALLQEEGGTGKLTMLMNLP